MRHFERSHLTAKAKVRLEEADAELIAQNGGGASVRGRLMAGRGIESSHLCPILSPVGWCEAEGEANAGYREIASRYPRA